MSAQENVRKINVTGANIRYGHLYVTGLQDFLPPDVVGSNSKDDRGVPIEIELVGMGEVIRTDIGSGKDGKRRGHFRDRTPFRRFYSFHDVQPGDALTMRKVGARRYQLSPENGSSPVDRSTPSHSFNFIDLFAGIGGLRLGFEAAGGNCVFTSEWNKFAQQTYAANFTSDHEIAGDITEVDVGEIPKHDVLLAGFPCQPFSIAGVSKKNALGRPHGFHCDTQGTLFFDVARILEHHRPKAFLLENVKNLVGHDRGRTFAVIRRTLEQELGYHIDYRVIDAKPFVPQHRERIFIVGFREDVGFSFDTVTIPPVETGPRLRSILHPQDGTEAQEPPYTEGTKAKVAKKYTLSQHLWSYLQDYAKKHKARGNGFGFGLVGPGDVARTLSARYYKDGSEILIRQKGTRPRRLTPRECARLMGFDQKGRAPFKIVVSDTQAYKQFGNAVVVPVVEAIARAVASCLTQETAPPNSKQAQLFETLLAS